MSTTIDQKVVEMRFDNAQFERNISQSTNSLEKLKSALKLDGVGRDFQEVERAAKGLDLSGVSVKIGTLKSDFDALGAFATGIFQKLGFNAAETIGQISRDLASVSLFGQAKAGWSKNDLLTQATQTIVAAGYGMDQVSAAMERLNWYTDETSYDFIDMANNIGKFTAQNVPLETAATAMQGISNWAARSGQHVQEAGRAMYNLSQSLAQGSVKLIDWKSIENANMATAEFKRTAIETAVAIGTLRREGDKFYTTSAAKKKGLEVSVQNFSQTLSSEWFSSKVLLSTLERYGSATNKLYEFTKRTGLTATELLDAIDQYKKGTLVISDLAEDAHMSEEALTTWLSELTSKEYELGIASLRAAQEALSLEQAITSIKDAASTSWMNIFKTIFGNYEEAKGLWTTVAEDLYNIFVEPVNDLQAVVKGAFLSNFEKIENELNDRGLDVDLFKSKIIELGKASGAITDDMVQNGKLVGTSFSKLFSEGKLTSDTIRDALNQLSESTSGIGKSTDALEAYGKIVNDVIRGNYGNGAARIKALTEAGYDYASVQDKVNKVLRKQQLTLEDLTDADLKALGMTSDQIEAWKEVANSAGEAGSELSEFIDNVNQPVGRVLFADAIHNALLGVSNIIGNIHDVWENVMAERTAGGIYGLLQSLNSVTKKFAEWTEETDIVSSALEILATILTAIGEIAETAASIAVDIWTTLGEVISKVWKRLNEDAGTSNNSVKIINKLSTALSKIRSVVKSVLDTIKNSQTLQTIIDWIISAGQFVFGIFSKIFGYIEEHLPGIQAAFKYAWESVKLFFQAIKENETVNKIWSSLTTEIEKVWKTIKDNFGTAVEDIGKFFDSFQEKSPDAENKLQEFQDKVQKIVDTIKGLFGKDGEGSEFSLTNLLPRLNLFEGWESFKTNFAHVLSGTEEGAGKLEEALDTTRNAFKKFRRASKGDYSWLDETYDNMSIGFESLANNIGAVTLFSNNIEEASENAKDFGNVTKRSLNTATDSVGSIEQGVESLANMLSKINVDRLVAYFTGGAIIGVASKMSNAIKKFANAVPNFNPVISGISSIETAISKRIQQRKYKDISIGILAIAGAIGLLTVSLYGIAKIAEGGRLEQAAIVLGGIAIGLALFYGSIAAINKWIGSADWKTMLTLLAIPFILSSFAGALKKLSTVNWNNYGAMFAGIGAAIVGMIIVCAITENAKGLDLEGMSKLTAIPLSFYLFGIALSKLSTVDWEHRSSEIISGIFFAVTSIIAITRWAKNIDYKPLLAMAGIPAALLILALAFSSLRRVQLDENTLINLVVAIGTMFGMIVTINLMSKDVKNAALTLAGAGAAIFLMSIALRALSGLKFENGLEFAKAMSAILAFLVGLAIIAKAAQYAGENANKLAATFAAVGSAMLFIALAMDVMSLMDKKKMAPVIVAVGVIMAMMALIVRATKDSQAASKALIGIMFCVGMLIAAVALLSSIENFESFWNATGIVAGIMLALAGLLWAASKLQSDSGIWKNVISMVVMIAALAGALYILTEFTDSMDLLQSVSAFAIAILALAAALWVVAQIPVAAMLPTIGTLVVSIIGLGLAAVAAGAGLGVLGWGLGVAGNGVLAFVTAVVQAVLVVANGIVSLIKIVGEGAEAIGVNLIGGIVKGIVGGIKAIVEGALDIGRFLIDTVKQVLDINSPSKVFMEIGGSVIEGLVLGTDNGLPLVSGAGKTIASTLFNSAKSEVEGSDYSFFGDWMSKIGGGAGDRFGESVTQSARQGIQDFNSMLLSQSGGFGDVDPAVLEEYGTKYGEIFTTAAQDSVTTGMTDVNELLQQYMGGDFEGFDFSSLGGANDMLSQFSTSLSGVDPSVIDNLSTSFDGLNTSITNFDQNGVTSLTDSITNLVTATDDGMTQVLDKLDSTIPLFGKNGTLMIETLSTGMSSKREQAIGSAAFIVDGVIEGITAMLPRLFERGQAIGNALLSGAQMALDINSPSRQFAEIGRYSVLGLINSVSDKLESVRLTGASIGEALVSSAEESLLGFDTLMNDHVISPVVDLSKSEIGGIDPNNHLSFGGLGNLPYGLRNNANGSQITNNTPVFNIYQQPGQDPEELARVINRELGRMYVR